MNRHLFRSPDDRILAGVAGGMAETYDFDPALVRVMWALLILVSGGLFLVIYILMALVVPMRPAGMLPWGPTTSDPTAPGGPAPAGPGDPSMPAGAGPMATPTPAGYYRHYRRHDGSGALVFGMILILAGAYFLLRQYLPTFDWGLVWPVFVIGGGLLLILFALTRTRQTQ